MSTKDILACMREWANSYEIGTPLAQWKRDFEDRFAPAADKLNYAEWNSARYGYLAGREAQLAERGEPETWQFQSADGIWHGFIDDNHKDATIESGRYPIRALYLHPPAQPASTADIEALRAALSEHERRAALPTQIVVAHQDATIAQLKARVAELEAGRGEVVAWATEDGQRVVTAKTMRQAKKDGGAILTGLSAFTVAAYRNPPAPPVAPAWYSRDEIVYALRTMKYSDDVAQELADWMRLHLQAAFNKGFSVAQRDRTWANTSGTAVGLVQEGGFLYTFDASRDFPPGTALYTKPQPAAQVPDGWQLVPIKSTQEMAKAFRVTDDYARNSWQDAYTAMLAAAPNPEPTA